MGTIGGLRGPIGANRGPIGANRGICWGRSGQTREAFGADRGQSGGGWVDTEPPTPASEQPAAEWCEDPWEQVSATPPPEVAEAMPQELAEQVRPLGLQRKWRGRGRGRRHIFAAEAQGVQPETLRILTEGMEVMEERTYVGAASAMVARLPPRTPTQRGDLQAQPRAPSSHHRPLRARLSSPRWPTTPTKRSIRTSPWYRLSRPTSSPSRTR